MEREKNDLPNFGTDFLWEVWFQKVIMRRYRSNEHGRILKALQEHNVEAAEKEMYAHIMRSRDDMLTYYK